MTLSKGLKPSISLRNWVTVEVVSFVSLNDFYRLPRASI